MNHSSEREKVVGRTDQSENWLTDEPTFAIISEYNEMIEELRTRLNVLSTSLFLLHQSDQPKNEKYDRYLGKIDQEMERIRLLISQYPKAIQRR